jgi:anti-sigma factor RsiW
MFPDHLDDTVLNEYLDRTLPTDRVAGVEAHLATCPDCAFRLAELQQVFAALSGLPDEPAPHDLAPAVLACLKNARSASPARRFSPQWVTLFSLEAVAGVACLAWLWVYLDVPVPTLDWRSVLQVFTGSLNFIQSLQAEWFASQLTITQLYLNASGLFSQVPAINLPERWLVFLIPIGAALWVTGNTLLLRLGPNQIHGGNNE